MSKATAATAAAAENQVAETASLDPLRGLDNCRLLAQANGVRTWECSSFCGRPCLIQQLLGAPQKHPVLDRKVSSSSRLQQAVRGMCKARKLGVRAPVLYQVDLGSSCVYTSPLAGISLQQLLAEGALDEAGLDAVMTQLSRAVSLLHDGGFVHGSLGPANVFWQQGNQQLELCGFDCSFNSTYPDDKAADLFILEAALQQRQPAGLFERFMTSYKKHSRQWSATFNKLAGVRKRAKKQQPPPAAEEPQAAAPSDQQAAEAGT